LITYDILVTFIEFQYTNVTKIVCAVLMKQVHNSKYHITEMLNVAVWRREELIEAFMPIWEKIYFQEPEGILFRLPVDPVALGVPVSEYIA